MTARASTEVAPRDASLLFRNGKLIAVETHSGTYTVPQLVAKHYLSFTDRMILDQIAARVDKLVHQLDAS